MVVCMARTQVGLRASAEEMWPAFKNAVSLLAQHCPHFIHSCQLLHGDGGPGTIRLVKFGPASGLVTYAKEEILAVDEDNMGLTYLLLEGDLRKQFKLFKPSISLQSAAEASSIQLNEATDTPPAVDAIAKTEPPIIAKASEDPPLEALDEPRRCSSIAVWTVEYEVEEGMPSPQMELLNEGAKIFFKLLEDIVLSKAPAAAAAAAIATPTTPQAPIMENQPAPLVA